jgi:EpsI family protein
MVALEKGGQEEMDTKVDAIGPVAPRLWLATGVLAVVQLGILWAGAMGLPSETTVPHRPLRDLPTRLGTWTGEDTQVDPRLATADHAYASVHRAYRNPAGETVVLYAAVFADVEVRVSPHSPESCYAAAGYQIPDVQDLSVPASEQETFSARLLRLNQEGRMGHVLFWYQVPGTTYVDSYGQRKVFYAYRGKSQKPAVVKIMLQTAGPNASRNAEVLTDFAKQVYVWTKQWQEAK